MRPTSARVAVSVVVALAWAVSVVEAGKKNKQAEETELYPEIEHLQEHVSNFLSQASVRERDFRCRGRDGFGGVVG